MRKATGPVATLNVKVGDIGFDEGFNREVDQAWVNRLVADLDSRAVGAVVLSQRDDGTQVVIDGQHRVRAILEKWGANATVVAIVHRNLTRAAEADLFYRLNLRRGLRAFDRFRAEVVARHTAAVEIVQTLENRGLGYGRGTSDKVVAAITSMEKAHALGTLGDTLTLLGDSWGYNKATWDGYLVEGVALFLSRYPTADVAAIRTKLAKYRGGAEGFLGKAKQWKALHQIATSRAVAALLVDTYNSRRGPTGQIPAWA